MENSIYPNNIIGILFRLLDAFKGLAEKVVSILFQTPMDLMVGWVEDANIPEFLRKFLTSFIELPSHGILDHFTFFELLLGTGFVLILIVGVVKFFGDLIGL